MLSPLHHLFARCVSNASKMSNVPLLEDSVQDLVRATLTELTTLKSRIANLSLFSPNETLEDISTKDLIYLLTPYVTASVLDRLKTAATEERSSIVQRTQKELRSFLHDLENYDVVSQEDRSLYKGRTPVDPSKRRELKIRQYQKEKDLRNKIETARKRRSPRASTSDGITTDFDLVLALLPTPPQDDDPEDCDFDTDEVSRGVTLLLLRLFYVQAQAQLENTKQELELLMNVPPSPQCAVGYGDRNNAAKETDADMWKLDAPSSSLGGKGPLLDASGKPLRPFVILPSDAANRARLQAQVFRPGHNLPTMTVDEYLEIERQRGNILSGGGPASEAIPTSSEQLALDAEMDGTQEGEEKEEMKRKKDENWARFTDENPRGAGNTMNRG